MDSITHFILGLTIYRNLGDIVAIFLFSNLPDIFCVPTRIYFIIKQGIGLNVKRMINWEPSKKYLIIYRFFHSLLFWGLITLLLLILKKNLVFSVLLLSHILLDIPTHSKEWGTRIFYPFSDFHFEGINYWENQMVIFAVWFLLFSINLLLFLTPRYHL